MDPGEPTNLDLADGREHRSDLRKLPLTLDAARDKALNSAFVRGILGDEYLKLF